MTKLLFICSRNQWRSPTAEKIYRQKGYSMRSAGTSPSARKTVSVKDVEWSDIIFVMEKKHKVRLVAKFDSLLEHKALHILDIPDDYNLMDVELVSLLEETLEAYL